MEPVRSIQLPRGPGRFTLSAVLPALGLLLLVTSGCQRLGKTAPNEVTSVVIANQSLGKVAAATEVVFVKHGFQGGRTGPSQFTYSRVGSAMDAVVYGEWIDRKVAVRVVATMSQVGTNSVRVAFDARMVSAPGDNVFEESFKVRGSDKKEIEAIAAEIAAKAGESGGAHARPASSKFAERRGSIRGCTPEEISEAVPGRSRRVEIVAGIFGKSATMKPAMNLLNQDKQRS